MRLKRIHVHRNQPLPFLRNYIGGKIREHVRNEEISLNFIISALAVVMAGTQNQAISPRLLMYPNIHNNTVVFSEAGDLWSTNIHGGLARRLTSGYGSKVFPFISPDGKQVAFTAGYDGAPDVYVIPIDGGVPKRLTYDSSPDVVLGWTPAGKIAYYTAASSPYLGRQADMWLISPNGGLPQSTPIHEIRYASFFAGSDKIAYNRKPSFLFNWRRYRGGTQGFVSFYNLKTNHYSELPHGREQQYYPMAVGDEVYYVSDKDDNVLNLWVTNLKDHSTKKITHFKVEDIKWASTDGHRIALLEDGFIWIYNIQLHTLVKLDTRIASDDLLSRPTLHQLGTNIANISISPSGERIAVEARGEIFSVPAKTGVTRDMTNTQGTREQMPAWSPNGQTVAYVSDATGEDEIYTMPQMGGAPTQITHLGVKIEGFQWFPDGKKLAFTTVNGSLNTVDIATKKVVLVEKPKYRIGGMDISPDSKWIAFTDAMPTDTTVLKLYNVETGKLTPISSGAFQNRDVAFDKNGKYLYMTSNRTFHPTPGLFQPSLKITGGVRIYAYVLANNVADPFMPKDDEEPLHPNSGSQPGMPPGTPPHPRMMPPGMHPGMMPPGMRPGMMMHPPTPKIRSMRIDIGDLARRIVPIPLGPGQYSELVGGNDGFFYRSGPTLWHYSMSAKQPAPVIAGPIQTFDINPSQTKLAYYGAGTLGEINIGGPPVGFGAGKVDTSGVEYVIDPRAEWKEIYWEAWRFIRDHYYDKNMRGMNWQGIGDHYATYLKWVNSRSDLNVVIGYLLAELGTSHSYITNPGDLGPQPTPIPVGYLGCDYKAVDGHIQISRIYRGDSYEEQYTSPLAIPGINVNPGDYLLAIDGQSVYSDMNPASMLIDKVGKLVTITVNSKPTLMGARNYQVRPIASEANLRYDSFLHASEDLVKKLSDGKIGYMHIRDTEFTGSEDFARGFFGQTNKEALIIDERWNAGGFVDPGFITQLAKKVNALIYPRHGGVDYAHPAMGGPEAMLINGYAGSGGDLFPWTFKHLGLGPLIGERTWGGLVGINAGANLVDGGSISTPAFAVFNSQTNHIIAENHGIDPNIKVDARPDLVAKGEDPQLVAAVNYLMAQLKKLGPPKANQGIPTVSPEGHLDLPSDAPFGKP